MSFRDLEHGPKGHASKQQPKQRRQDEESCYERSIRANVQELQEGVRKAAAQLEQAQRGCLTKRSSETLERQLERSRALSEETERLFRDWTVHLAGEPTERHRKKFSYEKLQKAFEEEIGQLKDVTRRALVAHQEAQLGAGRLPEAGAGRECRNVCDDQDASVCDAETGLLDDHEVCGVTTMVQEDATLRIRATIAQERDEGIRRIQCQVSEVNQMFRDLASIVVEQGQQFESIERGAADAAGATKQAAQELRKAVDRQRGTRERLCCMLATAVFVLCFIILPHTHILHPHLPQGAAAASAAGEPERAVGQHYQAGFGYRSSATSAGADSETPRVLAKTGQPVK